MGGGFDKKPGGSPLTSGMRAESMGTPGKRSLTERLPPRPGAVNPAMLPRLQLGSEQAPSPDASSGPTGTGAAPVELPHRAEMERRFGTSFESVEAHVGQRGGLNELGAHAAAEGDVVAFADENPDPDVVAHELTHVMQQRGGSAAPAASRDVAPANDPAEAEAHGNAAIVRDDPAGTRSLQAKMPASASLHLDRGDKPPPGDKTKDPSASADLTWAGAGKAGKIFRNATTETFIDPITKDSVDTHTTWTLAEFDQFEIKTNMAMEVERKIHLQLAHGGLIVKSKVNAWFSADRMPNDVHAALELPAGLLKHDGVILASDDKGLHTLRAMEQPLVKNSSPAQMLGGEPLLSFEAEPRERIRGAAKFMTATLPKTEENLAGIQRILDSAPLVAKEIKRHIEIKLKYEDPPAELLEHGRNLVARINEMVSFTATGYEGMKLIMQLQLMSEHFTKLIAHAEVAKPDPKTINQIQDDEIFAIGHAGEGVVNALKETGLLIYDLWPYGAFATGLGGFVHDWKPESSVGKAFKSGKSGSEVFVAVVEGFVDNWSNAIEHAGNGDYSKLMDLTAEFGVDLAVEVASGGGASPALAGRATEHALSLSEEALEALARRTESALDKAKRFIAKSGDEAKAAVLDTFDTLAGLLDQLRRAERVAAPAGGVPMRSLDVGGLLKGMQRARGARALEAAKTAMGKLRGGAARAQGSSVIAKLEKLAANSKMPDVIYAIAKRIADGENKAKFVDALDKVLAGTARGIDDEIVTGILSRAADAVDPIAILEDVEWTMARKGIKLEARQALLRQAFVRSKTPLDLRWLRELTELPDEMLEFMALDPATNWKTFMKVSKKPSDLFPSSVKKLLERKDYARANAKLRGVAGELIFDVEGVELPGGFKIVARQVDAAGKKIDFALRDASGAMAKLEVKAWTAKRWAEELTANARRKKPKGLFKHMVDQLRAAKGTGEPVYLAVSDAIGADKVRLLDQLADQGLADVEVITFPETKLKDAATKLREGMGIAAGVATAAADEIAKAEAEDSDD